MAIASRSPLAGAVTTGTRTLEREIFDVSGRWLPPSGSAEGDHPRAPRMAASFGFDGGRSPRAPRMAASFGFAYVGSSFGSAGVKTSSREAASGLALPQMKSGIKTRVVSPPCRTYRRSFGYSSGGLPSRGIHTTLTTPVFLSPSLII